MSNPWADWLGLYDANPFVLSRKRGWDAFVNAGRRPQFETLSRSQMSALTPDEREDYDEARNVWNVNLPVVKTHQFASAFAIIDQVVASGARDGDRTRGTVVLDSEPGIGKTTIATCYAKDFHRREYRRRGPVVLGGSQRLPVAFISLTEDITLKGLDRMILEFYGHLSARKSSTRPELTSLAMDCILSCQTKLIVIDDLHFVNFGHQNGQAVSNHLKGLANQLPVTFIYTGVGLRERRFFDEGLLGEQTVLAQTSRRSTRCPVTPFSMASDAAARGWIDLLTVFERHLMLADATPGMLTDHAKEIYRRTQGRIVSLTALIDHACRLAILTGIECITDELLAEATIDNAAQSSLLPS